MDIFDQATEREEMERELSIKHARNAPQRGFEAEVCNGCGYVTKTNYGRSCEAYRECLQDIERRERACKR